MIRTILMYFTNFFTNTQKNKKAIYSWVCLKVKDLLGKEMHEGNRLRRNQRFQIG